MFHASVENKIPHGEQFRKPISTQGHHKDVMYEPNFITEVLVAWYTWRN